MSYFYISIGTNITPEKLAVTITQKLCERYGSIFIYPFVYTSPIKMNSNMPFLNSLAVIKYNLDENQIKNSFNKIETSLGRNRDDPYSPIKDRVADIDIIYKSEEFNLNFFSKSKEPFNKKVLEGKKIFSSASLPIQRPSTIDLDRTTGDIIILSDKVNCF
ncbi:2-amino-4-hydroxy-6-hydroxymethyldihydropteridine diphosphokinase [Pseudoalteromonas sp. 0303]|uniref:2-amino-4-hydroxy-6- hydroxymethyldihydropteridine diphosphokinase n=1 Tax=Pseudoalteromonas TaxID=53246 RepID=UPI0015838FAA|nr:2-amino-4-hydroxy-6-hydroxymethyldihydropteridine diphosphokinase [Pseudoalteromonas sp. 0303]